MVKQAQCLGDLDAQEFAPCSVRDEIRRNIIRILKNGETLFPGIVGYEDTVEPQLVNALLSKHDLVLLGLRGQAKTRLCRMLTALLDEYIPVVAGSALREHPFAPITKATKALIAEAGDDLSIEWLHREERYGEKLATPDVSVADLIGDIDPLKAAHKKMDLSNEEVIHYGIIPRSNRGIFTINEVPDLAPRIQVGLLNLLEEQDIQIRGFPLRLPLDVLMVFTANPEDYTNRGSIITPLKDRIASQIITHYPRTLESARQITADQSWDDRGDDLPKVRIPDFFGDIIEDIAFRGRDSEFIDQKSGVSARLSIAARELLISQVERRTLMQGGDPAVPRIVDLFQLIPAITGKVELVYEGEQEGATKVARHLIGGACRHIFDELFPRALSAEDDPSLSDDAYRPILEWFSKGQQVDIEDECPYSQYESALNAVPGLREVVLDNIKLDEEADVVLAMELVLEGLHQHSLISKLDVQQGVSYGDMLRSMLEDIGQS